MAVRPLILSEFQAMTFDCYGTLIDWEAGLLEVLRPWARLQGLRVGDEKLLEAFAAEESIYQSSHPGAIYPEVLAAVFAKIGERFNKPVSGDEAAALGDSIKDWPPFADTPEALKRLKKKYKLVILSNIDNSSFQKTNSTLGVSFDAIITAQDVGSYKPAAGHFYRGIEVLGKMGVAKGRILHVAQSLYHDHVPAKALGLTTVWVDRRQGKPGGATPMADKSVRADVAVTSLAELADLCGL